MLRSLVRPRPYWPRNSGSFEVQAPRVFAAVAPQAQRQPVRSQPFHSTASASIGFTNFKNSPRPKWKTQQELDAKNAAILAERQPRVPYTEAVKSHKPRAWIGARKKVVWGRLFGPSSGKQQEQEQ
ncbi:unnamed protein product [Scytosiphon promiscuus]